MSTKTPSPEELLDSEKDAVLERAGLAVLEVGHQTLLGLVGGMRYSKQKGAGFRISRVKEFDPTSDDPREIMHAATASTGGQIVYCKKTFGKRDVPVYVLVDLNRTLKFGSTRAHKLRLAAEMVATVIRTLEDTKDRVGFIAYANDDVIGFRRPSPAVKVMDEALTTVLRPPESTGQLDSGLIRALEALPAKKSVAVIVSDFLNLTPEQKEALSVAADEHELIFVCVQDEREKELPEDFGLIEIQDLKSGRRKTILNWYGARNTYRANFLAHVARHEAFCEANNIRNVNVMTQEGPDQLLERLVETFAVPVSTRGGF